jgi:aspartate/methionine/tyrosine aminotransferase
MLEEAGVAATPGVDFDPVHGRRYVRFSYAGAEAEVAEAVQRMTGWLRRG